MKILMINSVCGIRSTGRICTDLAIALEEQGHEVKIGYGREAVPEQYQKYAVRIGSDLDSKLHGVKTRLFDGEGTGSKRTTEKFIEWVKEFDPDVIHIHNIHGYYINTEVFFNYLKNSGKKIIWTLHDCWSFTGHSGTCDEAGCERWKTGCYKCPLSKRYPTSLFIDRSKQNWCRKKKIITAVPSMTIVTPSNWLAGLVRQSYLNKYEIRTIHNGIDLNNFYPLENDFRKVYGIEDKFMVLGVASSWSKMKGLDDFIELSHKLGDECRIVIVGLKQEQMQSVPDNIIKIERTDSVKELAQIYSTADVFMNLTYCDNYPTTNLEAISCGTPVITYRTGGSSESVGDKYGFVVEQGDLDAVVEKIKLLREQPLKFDFLEKENKSFGKASAMQKYLNIYSTSKLVGGGTRRLEESTVLKARS